MRVLDRMKKLLVVGVIVLFLGVAIAPSIQSVQHKTIEDKAYKPTCIPFITYTAYTRLFGNFSELSSPIPPGNEVFIPLTIEYSTNIPQIFRIIPWPLNTLWLFYSFVFPAQKIYFANSDVSDYIDVQFSPPLVFTHLIYSGEQINISILMAIWVKDNTPCGTYEMELYSYFKDVGRIRGDKFTRTITFEVGYE